MNLIFVPTRFELERLDSLDKLATRHGWSVEVCGFGPVAAAACAAKRIAEEKAQRVILVGTAGAMDDRLKIGSAYEFSEVVCYGVGIGFGSNYQGLHELHWLQQGDDQGIPKGDSITLAGGDELRLLTCCAASTNADEVKMKRDQFPHAAAEEMEGFGVAVACAIHEVPLHIVRGISNRAGDRNKDHWQIAPALQSAGFLASKLVEA